MNGAVEQDICFEMHLMVEFSTHVRLDERFNGSEVQVAEHKSIHVVESVHGILSWESRSCVDDIENDVLGKLRDIIKPSWLDISDRIVDVVGEGQVLVKDVRVET